MTVEPPERDLLSTITSKTHPLRTAAACPHKSSRFVRIAQDHDPLPSERSGRMLGLLCEIDFDTNEADPGCRITPTSPRRAGQAPLDASGSTDSDVMSGQLTPLVWLATSFTGCRSELEKRQSRLLLFSTSGRAFERKRFLCVTTAATSCHLNDGYHDQPTSKTRN